MYKKAVYCFKTKKKKKVRQHRNCTLMQIGIYSCRPDLESYRPDLENM